MRHLDGETEASQDPATQAEVEELMSMVVALKSLPLYRPDTITDQKIYQLLEEKEPENLGQSKIIKWLPYILVAASLAMLLYVFLPEKLAQRYDLLETNPDRISFIHDLNEQELSADELFWLVSLFEREEHPNIRVILLDLLENQGAELPTELTRYLVKEQTPAVQMAFLNTLDKKYAPEMKPELVAFNEREDLDPLVRECIEGILINK